MDTHELRKDFPVLSEMESDLVYFDNSCMTLRPLSVINKVLEYYREYPGCGGRSLHRIATRVTDEFEEARKVISDFIGAPDEEGVVFTKNTTESINLLSRSFPFQNGDKVLGTDHEHNSNLVPWVRLMKEGKIRYEPLTSKEDNTFDIEEFKNEVKGTRLVSMVHVSNLDGTMVPAKDVIDIAHDSGAQVMLDCAQSVPHMPVDMKGWDLDFMAFSGHKVMGPTGTGVLAGKLDQMKELRPFIVGGDTVQETTYSSVEFLPPPKKYEGGLQNYAGFIGLKEAVRYLSKVGVNDVHEHEIELNRYATERMKDIVTIMGPKNPEKRGGIIPFQIEGFNPHDIALMLDELSSIAVRSGRHCVHSWFQSKGIESSIRASFYLYNTRKEIDLLVDTISTIIEDLS